MKEIRHCKISGKLTQSKKVNMIQIKWNRNPLDAVYVQLTSCDQARRAPLNIDNLGGLVPCAQSKKCEKHPWRSVTFVKLKPTNTKVILLHWCFKRFLNCTNGTKLHKTSNMTTEMILSPYPSTTVFYIFICPIIKSI